MEEETCLPRHVGVGPMPSIGISCIVLWRERAGQLWETERVMAALRGELELESAKS